jgi:hypothetical protein
MPIGRVGSLILFLALAPGSPARAELAWPALCARLEVASERQPDEERRYRMLLNDRPAGWEVFRFWREGGQTRVVVRTELEGHVLVFPADFRHCRGEWWRGQGGVPELVELEAETRYAVPFKPDTAIRFERDPDGHAMVYRTVSSRGASEERYPENTGAVMPWSIRTTHYDRLVNVFEHGVYRAQSRLAGRATVAGHEIVHYAFAGEWPRHLWYSGGKMIRFCALESFGTHVETVLETYADLDSDVVGLNRSCAELFE